MTTLDDIINKQNQQNGIGFTPADLEHSGTKQSQAVQAAVEEDNKPITTYQDIYKKLNPRPSEAELEAERKRQRRNALIAAIGDGISAIANMHYAGKGAPSSYDPRLSLSAKLQERYDKLNAEHRAHDKEWRAGYVRAQALDRQAENDRNRWKLYRRRFDAEQEKWQKEQEAKAAAQQKKDKQTDLALAIKQQEANRKDKEQKAKEEGRGGYGKNSSRSGKRQYDSDKKTTKYVDENGRPVTVVETRFTPSGSSRSGGSSSNNTPPGRRNRNTSNNTPPSRRQNR